MSDPLLAHLFGDPDVSRVLTDEARLQRMLDFESALAEAEASVGVIPPGAAASISAAARAELVDPIALAREAADAGNLAIPLVRHLTARVAASDADASRYVHWGATSQDVIDTGLVLQVRDAVPLVLRQLQRASEAAARQARGHADTLMAGRTWLQQATPITFGLKAAGWLDALDRASTSLRSALDDALVVQFGGAAGTLASLGTDGPAVSEALAARLGLHVPAVPWHGHRERLASLASGLGVVCGTAGKIARDLILLGQTEVGEASEGAPEGRGGSSTMPHKRNPVHASVILAAATRAPGLVATMLTAMLQEHERGVGGWQAEWETLPELLRLTGGAARATADALDGLVVDPVRMRENLGRTQGLVMAEAVAMACALHLGRHTAHTLVERASRRALAERRSLADVLAEDPAIVQTIGRDAIERLLVPDTYLGATRTFIDRVLAAHQSRCETDA